MFLAQIKAKHVDQTNQNQELLAWLKKEEVREKDRIRYAEYASSPEERLERIAEMNIEREERQAMLRNMVKNHRLELESVPI